MATAVQPGSETRTANPTTRLLTASLAGAVYILAAVAVAGYAVPYLWQQFVAPLVGAWRLLASQRAVGWMHERGERALFHPNSYKRSRGQRVRRYTIIGLLLVGLSGVWMLITHEPSGRGDWKLALPFTAAPF